LSEVAVPRKIVDLSARSRHIRDEPWHLHFWEETPEEALEFLRRPREALASMGIELPRDCRIETTIENHDWLTRHTDGLKADRGVVVCNVGGGNVGRSVYRVSMYAHREEDVGRYEKRLLHEVDREEVTSEQGA
jgi:hypothetical protein